MFNYHLSRARRVIENTFGILASRWRIFRRPMIAEPDRVTIYTKAAIALHNFLRTVESPLYCPPGFVDSEDGMGNSIPGTWRNEEQPTGLHSVSRTGSNRLVHIHPPLKKKKKFYGACMTSLTGTRGVLLKFVMNLRTTFALQQEK